MATVNAVRRSKREIGKRPSLASNINPAHIERRRPDRRTTSATPCQSDIPGRIGRKHAVDFHLVIAHAFLLPRTGWVKRCKRTAQMHERNNFLEHSRIDLDGDHHAGARSAPRIPLCRLRPHVVDGQPGRAQPVQAAGNLTGTGCQCHGEIPA
ncbi:hypothetical protein Bcep18194_C6806 [Burkholderia lata]|uniref:Uncharacterized protein n=1 Tax=Burkholderia lata (strain ATCC 17760 / DSM 23089 / LMG 22485 / NCIMB 9086 / R18194 / 383) TaxID=482957 RepID=Q39NW4_BURL3|nr:hypothetical protein Bcep18194_C6806 [Burkholderia lata]